MFGLVLGPAVFAILLWLPLPAGMPPAALKVGAVAGLMAIWWISEALPIAATALLPIVLLPALGVLSAAQTTAAYGNHLIFLFLGGFLIAMAMQKWNLHRRIALQIIRAVGTRLNRIVLGFMVATAFLSMWVSNTATAMMMLPIGLAVIKRITALWKEDNARHPNREGGRQALVFGTPLMLGVCRVWVIVASMVGERAKILPILRRIVGLFNEKSARFWPLSHQRSRLFPNPTGS